VVVTDHKQSFLEDVVAKLIVDQLLDDEVHSRFEVQRVVCLEPEFLDNLSVIIREGPFENLVNMSFLNCLIEFRIQALLDDVARKFELAQSDEILGNLLENAFVSILVLQLEDVLH
jgi:hypothetical protein